VQLDLNNKSPRPDAKNVSWLEVPALVSIVLLLQAGACYIYAGCTPSFLLFWLSGIAGIWLSLFLTGNPSTIKLPSIKKTDLLLIFGIAVVFGLIYLSFPYSYPYQINTDEIVIRNQIRKIITQGNLQGILGPSIYFSFPVMVHDIMGALATKLGGITLVHLRTVHASVGVLCLVCSYVFFRVLGLSRQLACVATGVFGINHSFLTIARLVSQNTFSPLVEVVALSILFRGMTKSSPLLMFSGGIVCGFSFYVHPPARIIFFLFLTAYFLSRWSFARRKEFVRVLLPAVIGFSIVIFPMVWSISKLPSEVLEYQHNQILFTPEGRKVQKEQVHAETEQEGVITNIEQGLLAFNWPTSDHSNIYINDGFGFVDPLTGILLWIGLIGLYRNRKRRYEHRYADILCSSALIFLWLLFSFCITFAPSYTRMTIVLPFVAYLVTHGILWTSQLLAKFLSRLVQRFKSYPKALNINRKRRYENTIFVALCATIVFLNFLAIAKFALEGANGGGVATTTFRMIERLKDQQHWQFVLSADNEDYVYYWQTQYEELWKEYMDEGDVKERISLVAPAALKTFLQSPKSERRELTAPFMLFLRNRLWSEIQSDFAKKYPRFEVKPIIPNGDLRCVTVQ
jgi:hypothetical protein